MSRKLSRLTFLEQLGGVTAASLGASVVGVPSSVGSLVTAADAAEMGSRRLRSTQFSARRDRTSYRWRIQRDAQRIRPIRLGMPPLRGRA
jgi:hypothetical protein